MWEGETCMNQSDYEIQGQLKELRLLLKEANAEILRLNLKLQTAKQPSPKDDYYDMSGY